MQTIIFSIPNISCGHCVNAVKNELSEQTGVLSVSGNPDTKKVSVDFEAPATEDILRKILEEINYPAE